MERQINLLTTPNRLLAGLFPNDRFLLQPMLHRQVLQARTYLERRGAPIRDVHFIESGIVSVLEGRELGEALEIGVIGWEGMTGINVLLTDSPSDCDCYVQVPGRSLVIGAGDLAAVLGSSPTLGRYLLRFVQAQIVQFGLTVSSCVRANVQQRLARKLLMYHDRLGTDDLPLTHENISLMLGVRRASVTVAIHKLEAEGWIRAQRRLVTIRDRAGLERYCAPIYGLAEARYEQLIGIPIAAVGKGGAAFGAQAFQQAL